MRYYSVLSSDDSAVSESNFFNPKNPKRSKKNSNRSKNPKIPKKKFEKISKKSTAKMKYSSVPASDDSTISRLKQREPENWKL